jgi:hypothetical protein
MEMYEIAGLILEMELKIQSVIETGAQWEIWLQAELAIALREKYHVMGRELPVFGTRETVDIGFTLNNVVHAIELKVEGATTSNKFAGVSLGAGVGADIEKLERLDVDGLPCKKWACCVAWSPKGKESLQLFGFDYIAFGEKIYVGLKQVA